MLRSRGRRLLFADADGATKFADIEKLESELAKLELISQAGVTTISRHCSHVVGLAFILYLFNFYLFCVLVFCLIA